MSEELLKAYRNIFNAIENKLSSYETEFDLPKENLSEDEPIINRLDYLIETLRDRLNDLEDLDESEDGDEEYTPPPIIAITPIRKDNQTYFKVEVVSATRNSFLVKLPDSNHYKVLKRVCQVAPVMWRLDGDLMEAYDNAGRTGTQGGDVYFCELFTKEFELSEVDSALPGFDKL